MINEEKLKEVVERYKEIIKSSNRLDKEKFKWEAPQKFKNDFDLHANDFPGMLNHSLEFIKSELTDKSGRYPVRMLNVFLTIDPNKVYEMFSKLYDESIDLNKRTKSFEDASEELINIHNKENNFKKNSFQDAFAISCYLALFNPSKYCYYKYKEIKEFDDYLNGGYDFNKKSKTNKVIENIKFLNEVSAYLKKDSELIEIVKSQLGEELFNVDSDLNILAFDIAFYFGKHINKENKVEQNDMVISQISNSENSEVAEEDVYETYTKEDFLCECFIDEQTYDLISNQLKEKKNIIFQGPPGVGKTFLAKRLVYSLIGSEDKERVKMIQFHQSYSYEDFIIGYKPSKDSFELKTGVFFDFVKKARKDSEHNYYFIIDEINRGNLSKIFGEILMLIENDHRNEEVELVYSDDSIKYSKDFLIPPNLYLIGLMNTADRSIALLDYALRRRFSFIDLEPKFDNPKFKEYVNSIENEDIRNKFKNLIESIKGINKKIDEDLGKGFEIGHSYFVKNDESGKLDPNSITENFINSLIKFDLIPTLREYYYELNEDEFKTEFLNKLS